MHFSYTGAIWGILVCVLGMRIVTVAALVQGNAHPSGGVNNVALHNGNLLLILCRRFGSPYPVKATYTVATRTAQPSPPLLYIMFQCKCDVTRNIHYVC